MRIIIAGALALVAWMSIGAWWHTCKIKYLCDEPLIQTPPPAKVEPEPTPKGAIASYATSVIQNGNPLVSFDYAPRIVKGSDSVYLEKGISGFSDWAYDYLIKNPGEGLHIMGYYSADEPTPSGFDNMGLARAEFLKGLLVKRGINPDRIHCFATLKDLDFDEKGHHFGGFEIEALPLSKEEIAEVDQGISHKNLYSNFGQVDFNEDPTLVAYTKELLAYLDKFPEKNIVLTGHTDNVGGAAANKKLGLQRAQKVRDYFVSEGIDKGKIKAISKGETAPIASNDDETGRQKNRRIEVIVE